MRHFHPDELIETLRSSLSSAHVQQCVKTLQYASDYFRHEKSKVVNKDSVN